MTLAFFSKVRDPSGAGQAINDAAGAPFSLTVGGKLPYIEIKSVHLQ